MLRFFSFLFLIVTVTSGAWAGDPLPWANPWDVGMDYEFVNKAYAEVAKSVGAGAAPGAVGLVIKDGYIVARRAIGNMQTHLIRRDSDDDLEYVPFSDRMLEETIFDLASITKMVSTTTAIMMLVEQGKIGLDDPVVKHIPTFGARAKDKVTVRHLLTHSSGLPSWFPFYQLYIDREDVYRAIDEDIALASPPGEKRNYSDLGFILLGRLVETASGRRLDRFAEDNIFKPLGMNDTGYLPRIQERLRTAPTEYDPMRDQVLKGIVHDENTQVMGGVSGHAGLFSTVNDMAIFAQMLLNRGEWKGMRILKEATIQTMLTPQLPGK
ncbi:MAG: beta-lactamase family protein, partial [Candidatus Omnitrophica bacterium]|nr:beta-lactamase family protein [Candidatus Omnitrophota bacterium]